MCRSIVAVALLTLLSAGSAQALEIIDVNRGVRLVDPVNNNFVFDQRNTTTGVFSLEPQSITPGFFNYTNHRSRIDASPTSISLTNPAGDGPAILQGQATRLNVMAETWVRMSFVTDGPGVTTQGTFTASIFDSFEPAPDAFKMSLFDATAGTMVFSFLTADFTGTPSGWSGTLAAGHTYQFDTTLLAFGDIPQSESVSSLVGMSIVAQPVPEPATAALMLAGLALAAGVARRRAARA